MKPAIAIVPPAVLRHPTVENTVPIYEAWRKASGLPLPRDATLEVTALACIHKARLAWSGSTKRMVRDSKAWLVEHAMSPTIGAAIHGTVQ